MPENNTITLEGLLEKTPMMLRPVVARYGPALVEMTIEEFSAWLDLIITGKDLAAWRAILAKLPGEGLLDAWAEIDADWNAANERNARRVALQREAVLAVLKVLLVASLSWVGL